MSETMNIEVQPREETGKNANRRSRARGKIPAVVYGHDYPSLAIETEAAPPVMPCHEPPRTITS